MTVLNRSLDACSASSAFLRWVMSREIPITPVIVPFWSRIGTRRVSCQLSPVTSGMVLSSLTGWPVERTFSIFARWRFPSSPVKRAERGCPMISPRERPTACAAKVLTYRTVSSLPMM